MTTASAFLDDLHQKRRKYVEGVELNGFEEGILNFLSDLYPDLAHFIYELLQNAEDAGATGVSFHLELNNLRVVHNGTRKFSREDVKSITGIGLSTKKDNINQIGKFGVGFKAVFSYSRSPRIFSGDFNFQIDDLVCPTEVEPTEREPEETVFSFLLGTARKPTNECFKEIHDALEKLDLASVLFLNNIERIKWKIEDGQWMSISRREPRDGIIEIAKSGETTAHFLRYQKALDQAGKLKCGIALRLSFRSDKQAALAEGRSLGDQLRFDPISGKLCIFFPAEKETTGLKFHVNGPFASTIDRASIPHDNKDNHRIIEEAAKLFCESMHDIKNRGLLSIDFLDILPNSQDDLPEFYKPFRRRIIDAMTKNALVPTKDRTHARATALLRGPKTITDVITRKDLQFLTDDGEGWAFSGLQSGRAERFLASLGIMEWSFSDLIRALDKKLWRDGSDDWLTEKDDDWMQQFYLLLLSAAKRTEQEQKLCWWSVLRTTSGDHLRGNRHSIYFPSEASSVAKDFIIIKPALLENTTKDVRDRLREFFTSAGVKDLGETEEIEVILDRFYDSDESLELSERQHVGHIRRFMRWLNENKEPKMFVGHNLLWGQARKLRHAPSACYLDHPFKKTDLSVLYDLRKHGTGSYVELWEGYATIKGFVAFAEAIGVTGELTVLETDTSNHPLQEELREHSWRFSPSFGIDQDFTIQDLDHILVRKDLTLSRLLWNTMRQVDENVFQAKFRANRRFDVRVQPSSLVLSLRDASWIPSKDGTFRTPAEMTRAQLSKTFEYDDANGWLTAIQFGENERTFSEESVRKQKFAKELGISLDDILFLNELRQNPDYYSRFRNELQASRIPSTFPERPVKDRTRRTEKMRQKLAAVSDKQYEDRSRSVRVSKSEVEAQTWLREQYRNEDQEIVCQLCSKVMPFTKRNGDYYFEAIAVSSVTTKEIEAVFLALCPLCAAKYMEFVRRDAKAEKRILVDLLASDQPQVQVTLGKEQATLRFVESHWHDVRTLIQELDLVNAPDS